MSMRNSFANKSKHRQCLLVFIVTVAVCSVIVFVACKQRFCFLVPGMGLLLFAGIAIALLGQACCELVSRRWPLTVGFMRCVRIVKSYTGNGHTGNSPPAFVYSLEVDYDYEVKGRRYNGKRVAFWGIGYKTWMEADRARRPFPQDKNVNVYYCPLNPSWSCVAHARIRDVAIGVSAAVAASVVTLALTLLAFYRLP